MTETLGEPRGHRVAGTPHNDGDRRRRLLERGQRRPSGDDHVDPETDQLSRQVRETLRLCLAPSRLGDEMLAIHVPELAQSAQERADVGVLGLGADHIGGRGNRTQMPIR
jgi:hypothetical protein